MKANSMLTGIGVGIAMGSAAVYAGSKITDKSLLKSCKKNTAKCMKSINSVLDSVSSMMK